MRSGTTEETKAFSTFSWTEFMCSLSGLCKSLESLELRMIPGGVLTVCQLGDFPPITSLKRLILNNFNLAVAGWSLPTTQGQTGVTSVFDSDPSPLPVQPQQSEPESPSLKYLNMPQLEELILIGAPSIPPLDVNHIHSILNLLTLHRISSGLVGRTCTDSCLGIFSLALPFSSQLFPIHY